MQRLIAVALMLLVLTAQIAQAVTATPAFLQTPKMAAVVASGIVQTTIYTAPTTGAKVIGLLLTNTTGTASTATCQVKQSATAITFLVISVAVNAGTANGVPAVNAFSAANTPGLPIDSDGNPFIYLTNASDSIQCASSGSAALSYIAIVAEF